MATILTTWTLWMVQQKWRHSGRSRSFFPAFGNLYRILLLMTLVIQSIPWAGGEGESAVRQCNAAVGFLEPEVSFYMTELYHRMILNDNTEEEEDGGDQWERIIATKKLDSPQHQHYLLFNISALRQSDNVTSARVALITHDRRNSCHPTLRETRGGDILPCENRPFQIEGLATVDVTSVLRWQLGQQQLQIYSQRVRHLHSASLIVFTGIDTAQLFTDNRALVCGSDMRRKRDADIDTLVQSKQWETDETPDNFSLFGQSHNRLAVKATSTAIKEQVSERSQDIGSSTANNKNQTRPGHPAAKISTPFGLGKVRTDEDKSNQSLLKVIVSLQENQKGSESSESDAEKRMPTVWLGRRKREQLPAERTLRLETPRAIKQHLAQMRKRSVNDSRNGTEYTRSPDSCQVVPWVLEPFEDLRMSPFISPLTLDVGRCVGSCPPVLHPSSQVSFYSYIKSLLYLIHPHDPWPVPAPCCQPTKFQSFSVMRFAGNNTLAIERWHNARVTACGCV